MARPPGVAQTAVLRLPPCAVTTSGDYERWFALDERHYSHIVDPRTGWPVADMCSVTVVAPDAITADALATGLSVMGAEAAVELVDSLPATECMMMVRQPDGTARRHLSRGFGDLTEGG